MIRKIERFDYNYPFGKAIPLPEFLKMYDTGEVNPHDGTITEVVINGYVTNVLVSFWNMYQIDEDREVMTLKDLEKTGQRVEIVWIERKKK